PSEEAEKKTLSRLAAPQLALSVNGATITVTFPKVQGAASYTIEYSTVKDFRSDTQTEIDQPTSGSEVSQDITGLRAKTTYHFRVTAKAAANSEAYADSLPVVKSAVFRTLRFETKGGSAVAAQVLLLGERAAKPTAPTKDGHTLYGWYEDEAYTQLFDFAAPVSKDRTLYAKWLDTSNYGVTYSSDENNKHFYSANSQDRSITLAAENVPADITSELRSVTIDLTIAGNPGTAPEYAEKLKELAKDAAKYSSPVSLSNADSGKAKVYAVVSRNFIRDAHGDTVGAGAIRKEYYFLSRMIKNLTDLRLNTKETGADGNEVAGAGAVKSGLIVPQDGNIRMRLITHSVSHAANSPEIYGYGSSAWKQLFAGNKYANTKYTMKKNTSNTQLFNSLMTEMQTISPANCGSGACQASGGEAVNVHFEMQGIKQSFAMYIKLDMTDSNGIPKLKFWVLVE
ncbi:MAG: InlB B-repeat-containing protein, partial [Spirochaetota bacterium]